MSQIISPTSSRTSAAAGSSPAPPSCSRPRSCRCGLWAQDKKFGAAGMPHGTVSDPQVFVSIAGDGTVSIVCHRSEMGQGVRTGVPLMLADEMEADWARVKVVQAPGRQDPVRQPGHDGSRSTRHFMKPMRECGAAARMMLEGAAAKKWGVPESEVQAQNTR